MLVLFSSLIWSAAAQAATAVDYAWTGASTSQNWSTDANWTSGVSPIGTAGSASPIGILTFPQLTSSTCATKTPSTSCYASNNDASSAVAMNGISLDDNEPYDIAGSNGISLGAGGLVTTQDSAAAPAQPTSLALGNITLTAPQTWSIDGGSNGDGVAITNGTIGGNEPLTVDFTHQGWLQAQGNVGPVTLSGPGALIPEADDTNSPSGGSFDTNGSQMTVENGATLWASYAGTSVGPLTVTGGSLYVGSGNAPEGSLGVAGALSLAKDGSGNESSAQFFIDEPGQTAGSDYSSVLASGNIGINGAQLALAQGTDSNGNCVDLNPGDVLTLLQTSSGTLSGSFDDSGGNPIANGQTVQIANDCNPPTARNATATINYTATAVTATIVNGGDAGDVPSNVTAPAITGNPTVGQTLTADPGQWTGTPSYTYQWYSCTSRTACSPISGAIHSDYVPTASVIGDMLGVLVTATNRDGSTQSESDLTSAVKGRAPTTVINPTVSGTPVAGSTLTANPGSWTDNPTTYSYAWVRCNAAGSGCALISGATASTYTLTAADVGNRVGVGVTATNSYGTSTPALSQETAVVAAAGPVVTSQPVIGGYPIVGQTLTGSAGSFSGTPPLTKGVVWQRCTSSTSCTPIPGATKATYKLTSADAGYQFRLVSAAFNSGGAAYGESALTSRVASIARVKADLAALLKPSTNAKQLLKKRGYTARYRGPEGDIITIAWTVTVKHKQYLIAVGVANLGSTSTLRVKLTGGGRFFIKLLTETGGKLRASGQATLTLPDQTIKASRHVTIRA